MATPNPTATPTAPEPTIDQQTLEQLAAQMGMRLAQVSLLREYVSGGNGDLVASWPWLQQLPLPDDDLDNLIGNDVYTRMSNDEQIASSTFLLIMMVLRREMQFDPAFADEDEGSEEFKQASDIRDFCERAIENLKRHHSSFYRVLFEILWNAMVYGNAVPEKTLELGQDADATKLLFQSIKVRPRQATAFVVDYHFNLIGLATYTGPYEQWLSALTGVLRQGYFISTEQLNPPAPTEANPAPAAPWMLVPREKFGVLSLLTRNNDPRGKSWWRPIYNAWYQKMRRLRQLDLFAKRYGLPIPIGTTAEGAQDQYPPGADGQPDRTKTPVTAETALLRVLQALMAGDSIAVPHGTEVDFLQNVNDGGSLIASLHYHDSQIVKGITYQKLATSPDAHQAKSSGEVHQDVLNSPIFYLKNQLCDMVQMDFLMPLVEINFGPENVKYTPKPSLGRIEPEDLAKLLSALGAALRSGGLHYSMLPDIWSDWGLPRANIEQWIQEIKEDREIMLQLGQPATGADATPGQTQGDKYIEQETGKRVTRDAAARIGGRQGAFSRDDEETDAT